MPTHITDHQAQAIARLVSQYRDKTSMRGVVALETAQIQILEDVLWDVIEDSIDSATGAQLDVWGSIINQSRGPMDDTTYRLWIKARMLVVRCGGRPDDILHTYQQIAPECTVTLIEQFPAGFVIRLGGVPPASNPTDLVSFLRMARAAGVNGILEYLGDVPANTFRFDAGPGFEVGKLSGAKR